MIDDKYQSTSLSQLFDWDERRELVLPNFQRDFVWDRSDQEKLLASFVVGLPVGSVLLLRGKGDRFASRRLCYREDDRVVEEGQCWYLLDGQQRISTLTSIFNDFFGDPSTWEKEWNAVYPSLQNRWFLRVKLEDQKEEDPFGWRDLHFDESRFDVLEPDELEPFIVCHRVLKKEAGRWHNPQYTTEELDEERPHRVRLQIAQAARSDGWVPLFSACSEESKPLHTYVLDEIAKERASTLREDVRAGERKPADLLDGVNPNAVEEYAATKDADVLNQAWVELRTQWVSRISSFIEELPDQQLACIRLDSDEINRAIPIFENLNRGGTPLSVFDLVVARAALDNPTGESLSHRLEGRMKKDVPLPRPLQTLREGEPSEWAPQHAEALEGSRETLSSFTKNQYLNLLSIFSCFDYGALDELKTDHIKKAKILNLTSRQINDQTPQAATALSRALAFLQMRCGVVSVSDVAYDLMVLPIAYVFHSDDFWESPQAHDRVEYWYWASLFGGAYREKQNRRCVNDVRRLYYWVSEQCGDDPFAARRDNIFGEQGYSDRETLLNQLEEQTAPKAMRTAILQYVLSKRPEDFLPRELFGEVRLSAFEAATAQMMRSKNGETHEMKIEVHHVCPLARASKLGETSSFLRKKKDHILNSPLNLTPISKHANNMLRDHSVDHYTKQLSSLSLAQHLLPRSKELKQRADEEDDSYYTRVIGQRFEKVEEAVAKDLANLR